MLSLTDDGRVRILTLSRPEALNAFNEVLYDATTDALIEAGADRRVAVVVLTGSGRAFSAGTDVLEMARRTTDPSFVPGRHGFAGMIDQLAGFPKPLLVAVNGLGIGVGATLLGFADLVFMASDARLRCPFTDLAVAPEAASSYTFPLLLGRQHASWALLSGQWLSAEECVAMGLAWKIYPPQELLPATVEHARILAAKPIDSLMETKRTIIAAMQSPIAEARARENAAFGRLLGRPANREALAAFAEKRAPDFEKVDLLEG